MAEELSVTHTRTYVRVRENLRDFESKREKGERREGEDGISFSHYARTCMRERGRRRTRGRFIYPHVTRRDREVVDFTRSHVINISELTNLMKMYRIEGYNGK